MVEDNNTHLRPEPIRMTDGSTQDFIPSKIEVMEDPLVLHEDFKKSVAIPYFKDIYKDLLQ